MASGFQPLTLSLVRCAISAAIYTPVLFFSRDPARRLKKQDVLPLLLSSLAGITLYYYFEYNGLCRTSAVDASLILAAVPILTLLAECLLEKKPPQPKLIFCTILSITGAALVIGISSGAHGSFFGNIMILIAACIWVAYIFLSRRIRMGYSSLAMNTWQSLMACITMLPLAYSERSSWQPISLTGWFCVLILGAVCSAECYFVYGRLISKLRPTISAMFTNLIPLSAMIGNLALGKSVSFIQIIGGIMIMSSVWISTMQTTKIHSTDISDITSGGG